ncbi:interferon regulatory factor 5 [Elysia marginata]|uniref:Interferon regulatory factor 5 n=1 Tax=Elysia marginata TaxID=1093978 RepID=A0AAV4FPI7_9GAST|nr:interferon regulatory factor 5 [Elysia marginata]
MEHPTKSKTKWLRNFMLKVLETDSCSTVAWTNKAFGEFKIEWYHINKIDSREVPEKFKIFLLYAFEKGHYKKGDKPNYTKYKTQLRSALTKIDDFIELTKEKDQELIKIDGKPCRIFRFSDWDVENTHRSPDSTVVFDVELPNHKLSQPHPSQLSQDEMLNLPSFLYENNTNIEVGHERKTVESHPYTMQMTTQSSDYKSFNMNMQMTTQSSDPNSFNMKPLLLPGNIGSPSSAHGSLGSQLLLELEAQQANVPNMLQTPLDCDILHQAMKVSEIPVPSTKDASAETPFLTKQEKITGMGSFSSNPMLGAGAESHTGIENFGDILQYCDGKLPSSEFFSTEQAQGIPSLSPDLQAIPFYDLIPSMPQHLDRPECQSMEVSSSGFSDADHEMLVYLFYGRPKTKVLERTVNTKGCRLCFGDKVFDHAFTDYEKMYGPKTVEELQMPPVDELPTHDKSIKDFISEVLDKMKRGLVLTFKDGDIYADRKSYCKIFAYDSCLNCQPLERSKSTDATQKVFDFKKFKESLEKGPRQEPYFILTFARTIEPDRPKVDPLDNVLVYAYVYHKIAQHMAQAYESSQSSHSSIQKLALSDLNTMDKLEENFRKMATK